MQAASRVDASNRPLNPFRHSDVIGAGGFIGANGGGDGPKDSPVASVLHPAATPASESPPITESNPVALRTTMYEPRA